ncbi:LysR family transcriptional regulator [Dactylosporangium sp. NPDC049742]|uniref:LysR family transcriptional regulator n=1 Tax=Dactylosporangium sp. NPDC049742 TaxID=3154737 RepID=UPI0034418873
MHERELRAFTSIAETGRMDLAAKVLGYSQPALSYQLKCLETALGATLFTRNPTGAKLTMAGQVILPTAQATLVLMESMKQTAGAVGRHPGLRLTEANW